MGGSLANVLGAKMMIRDFTIHVFYHMFANIGLCLGACVYVYVYVNVDWMSCLCDQLMFTCMFMLCGCICLYLCYVYAMCILCRCMFM